MSISQVTSRIFDYIIVGGGSSGCVLASRLTERPGFEVLLIEAGPDTPPGSEPAVLLQTSDLGAALAVAGDPYIWPDLEVATVREALPPLPNRAFYEQGRVLGGGSSVNVMAANRGLPSDYDEWEQAGASGWNWDGILPYFKKLERDLDFQGPLHGNAGPIPIRREKPDGWAPFVRDAAAGLASLGLENIGDQNGVFRDGFFCPGQSNENGLRGSAARGYLTAEVRRRPNLVLVTEAVAERIQFQGKLTTGVTFRWQGQLWDAQTRREVILTAGALRTPGLLLRAGIGPASDLKQFGIEILADRAGVGENLLDHPANFLFSAIPRESGVSPKGEDRHGLAARLSSGVDPDVVSDLYLVISAGLVAPGLASLGLWINKPSSRGNLKLRDTNPHSHLDIHFNLLSDLRDLARFQAGFGIISRLSKQSCLSGYQLAVSGIPARMSFSRPVLQPPSPVLLQTLLEEESALLSYLRQSVKGLWHASGTARMGGADDSYAVTDAAGRVYGVAGLRVADASLFPTIPRANTNLPTIATAEKIADLILGGGANAIRQAEKVI